MPKLVCALHRLYIELEDPEMSRRLKRVTVKSNGTLALKTRSIIVPYFRKITLNP